MTQNGKKSTLAKCSSGWKSTFKQIASPAFGRPFLCVGVLYLIMQWGEFNNLVIHMIGIFKDSKSSIEPELAPVFVGCVQVYKSERL